MNGNCFNEDKQLLKCPYRVYTKEHKAVGIGNGDSIFQEFYPCLGQGCIAYHNGQCMRVCETIHKNKR